MAAAKAGVHNLTYSLAVEWAPYGIRVNALVPGYFPHEDLPRDVLEANVGSSAGMNTPAQRLGRPHELAWAATYLCSPFAAMVTGSIFVMDGAMSLAHGPEAPAFRSRARAARAPALYDLAATLLAAVAVASAWHSVHRDELLLHLVEHRLGATDVIAPDAVEDLVIDLCRNRLDV